MSYTSILAPFQKPYRPITHLKSSGNASATPRSTTLTKNVTNTHIKKRFISFNVTTLWSVQQKKANKHCCKAYLWAYKMLIMSIRKHVPQIFEELHIKHNKNIPRILHTLPQIFRKHYIKRSDGRVHVYPPDFLKKHT